MQLKTGLIFILKVDSHTGALINFQEGAMTQLHQHFSDEQVAFYLQAYEQGLLPLEEVLDGLKIRRSRFYALLKEYRADSKSFSIAYQRQSGSRLSLQVEAAIEAELLRDKALIENPEIPITTYNYTALRDRLLKQGITVSVNTIIDRAKKLGCHQPRKKRKAHDREVLTSSIGALIQHDGSTHLWSPFATEKWTLTPAPNAGAGSHPSMTIAGCCSSPILCPRKRPGATFRRCDP